LQNPPFLGGFFLYGFFKFFSLQRVKMEIEVLTQKDEGFVVSVDPYETASFSKRWGVILGRLLLLSSLLFLVAHLVFNFVVPSFFPFFIEKLASLRVMIAILLSGTLFVPFFLRIFSHIKVGRNVGPIFLIILAICWDWIHGDFVFGGLAMMALYSLLIWDERCLKEAKKDYEMLRGRRSQYANLLVKNQITVVSIQNLKEGDIIQVKAGEVIPVDGIIQQGATSVDESEFIGEDAVVFKQRGNLVVAATINRDATIEVEVKLNHGKTFLNQVLENFENSFFDHKSRAQIVKKNLALVFSILLLVTFIFILKKDIVSSLDLTNCIFAVLVVLGFCFPGENRLRILMIAASKCLHYGVFIKNRDMLSKLSRLKTLFFDKTGTLTRGEFYFSSIFLENGVNQGQFLSYLFSLEEKTNHPLAFGAKTHPWYTEIARYAVADFKTEPGLGISGKVNTDGKRECFIAAGNVRFLKRFQMQISRALREKIDNLESMGETVIVCGWDGLVRGLVGFSDTLRTDVQELLTQLRKLKVHPMMLTGDHDEMISNLTYTDYLEKSYTRCLPEEKIKKIQAAKKRGNVVGMVASPFDNEVVLSEADVGLFLGTGLTLPGDKAGVVIFGKRLLNLVNLIHYARYVIGTLRYHIFFGVVYWSCSLFSAAHGLLSPLMALVVMFTSSIVMIALPLRLSRLKFKI